MAGIAGIATDNSTEEVSEMLGIIRYRGEKDMSIFEKEGTTLGIVWNESENESVREFLDAGEAGYYNSPGNYTRVRPDNGNFVLTRDELGVAPLYYGNDNKGNICFASEIKALLPVTKEINEMPPGHILERNELQSVFSIKHEIELVKTAEQFATDLYKMLDSAVSGCIRTEDTGSWLSGGLDSSAICALATRYLSKLTTFTAGVEGAPDLIYAREMANFLNSEHYEMIVKVDDLIKVLPKVIYHLESFDALLVRSSITNYLVARMSSDYVSEVFSGEGGDELFAGYEYLKSIPAEKLGDELLGITESLHNTALQRVDRSASAHGITAHVVFTHPEIVEFAFTIPVEYKICGGAEKWILRKALEGLLPDNILKRPKAKFWEGAGIKELISDYAERIITDYDFRKEHYVNDELIINSKEELLYYRIFRDYFGSEINLSWMGRTKSD